MKRLIEIYRQINISFGYYHSWTFATPNITIMFSKQSPFADFDLHIYFECLFWSLEINIDNSYKYYPELKSYKKSNNVSK